MKKKLLSLISAALCLCMVLSACGGPASSDPSPSSSGSQSGDNTQDKTLTIATMTETTSLSPLYMGVYNYSMCTMLYETLLKYEDGEVKGNLAESYSFNEDGTVMTLTLRQGITFHDGTPFNAEAVKKNLDFMHSNPQYMACPGIYDIESVEVADEYTVTITYPHPYYGYAYDFCWPDVGGMQSPNQIVEGDFQTVQGYVGTGPYIYEEYVPGEYTRFVRNENYWGEEPYFDEIIARYIPDSTSRLQALQTGEIDLVYGSSMISYQDYQQATSLDGVAGAIAEKDTRARDITLNASSGPLVDAKVRQAVSHAINKEEFSEGLTYGYEQVAEMPFPEGTPYNRCSLSYRRCAPCTPALPQPCCPSQTHRNFLLDGATVPGFWGPIAHHGPGTGRPARFPVHYTLPAGASPTGSLQPTNQRQEPRQHRIDALHFDTTQQMSRAAASSGVCMRSYIPDT